uniref:Uncharacterized protein n=1 Tax=uncultured Thiotrichaceae bacterium TaxID=298394 RepID=A0A6S6UK65_9GAMM|nr:MAG: Unknown protein [uncultured Thiotrichaceae bacterium]
MHPKKMLLILGGIALLGILPAFFLLVQNSFPNTAWRQSCQDWSTFRAQGIELNNNTWGKQNTQDYTQCIYQNFERPSYMGWRWEWPEQKPGVKAYPSLMHGYKPWNKHSSTQKLPLQLSELEALDVSFSVETKYKGAVNLLLEAWLTDSPNPTPYDRTSEIAIHLMQNEWPGQGGEYYESVEIDRHQYDVYINHNMTVPGDDHTWSYLSFVNTGKPILDDKINFKTFIDYLLSKKMIIETEYLTSVELGNEIDHGQGESRIEHFDVRIKQ